MFKITISKTHKTKEMLEVIVGYNKEKKSPS